MQKTPQQATRVDRGNPTPPPTHLLSSLTYDLSTKRLSRTRKLPLPETKTSFSRELSKRPFELLRKNTRLGNLQPISENNRTFKPSLIGPGVIEIPRHSVRTTKSIELLLQRQANAAAENTQLQEPDIEEKQISPRRINLKLSNEYLKASDESQKRPTSRIPMPSFNSRNPFSEETTPRPLTTEQIRTDSQHALLHLASPDFMLMGAHFTRDRLVLTDRAGKIVHQLTEGDSEANMLVTSTDELEACLLDEELVSGSGLQPPPSTAVEGNIMELGPSNQDVEPSIVDIPVLVRGVSQDTSLPPTEQDAQTLPPTEQDAQTLPPTEQDAQTLPPTEQDAQTLPPDPVDMVRV